MFVVNKFVVSKFLVNKFLVNKFVVSKSSSFYCYRPQRSSGKVIFSQASVILSTWGYLARCTPPPGQVQLPGAGTPPWLVHPPRRSLQWTVRILLECFLVVRSVFAFFFDLRRLENANVK